MKSINVELTQEDLNAIAGLFDAAVKATGVQGAKVALPVLAKLEAAVEDANAAEADEAR
jgi:hypothetical protein